MVIVVDVVARPREQVPCSAQIPLPSAQSNKAKLPCPVGSRVRKDSRLTLVDGVDLVSEQVSQSAVKQTDLSVALPPLGAKGRAGERDVKYMGARTRQEEWMRSQK